MVLADKVSRFFYAFLPVYTHTGCADRVLFFFEGLLVSVLLLGLLLLNDRRECDVYFLRTRF